MFKRTQKAVSEGAKHWYQDKYQQVLTQRNILALIALIALVTALFAVFVVMRMAPLKSVEPYLLSMDPKTGITQRVIPATRDEYAANPAIDRYFTAAYLNAREGYNINILRHNYDVVRVMSTRDVYYNFRRLVDPSNERGFVKRLGAQGQRNVRIRTIAYIDNPSEKGGAPSQSKIMRVNIATTETAPNTADRESFWVVTIAFEYADLTLEQDEQLLNPLGYTVTSYQIQSETL